MSAPPDPLGNLFKALRLSDDAEFEPSRVIGRYLLAESVGEGGMGVVWKAWDRQLSRWAALKVLKSSAAEPQLVDRLRREATAAGMLKHPNIVAIHEVGSVRDGAGVETHFIAMDFVDGPTLADAAPGLPLRERVRILETVARAVAHAHEQGVLHRDLKPQNVLLEPVSSAQGDGMAWRVYLTDFGLAKVEGGEDLTRTGAVMGTPHYMAPEQVRGDAKSMGPWTDVWAMGVMLFELLSGRKPFQAESAMEIYEKILREDPPLPRTTNRNIPADLETIALKALEKEPARRYDSAERMAADLRHYLAGEPVSARRAGAADRILRRARRNPAAAVLASVLALALLVGAVGGSYAALHSAGLRREREAEAARARVQDEAFKSLEVGRLALDQAVGLQYRRDAPVAELARQSEEALRLIERGIAMAPGLATGHYLRGRAWELRGWADRAEESFREAIRLDPAFGPARFHLGRLLLSRSFEAYISDGTDPEAVKAKAAEAAREAVGEIERAMAPGRGLDDPLQRELAEAMLAEGRGDSAELRRIAKSASARFAGIPGVEEFLVLIGGRGRNEDRLAWLDRAIAIRPLHPMALFLRGSVRRNLGDVDGAIADFSRSIELHPRFAPALCNRGIARREKGDFAGAIADQTLALDINPRFPTAFHNRGLAYHDKGDLERAIADFTRAIGMNSAYALAYNARGLAHRDREDLDAALGDFTRAVTADPRYARAHFNRGVIRQKKGDLDGAMADWTQAIAIDPAYHEPWVNRGTARLKKGDPDGAVADYERALEVAPADWPGRPVVEKALEAARRAAGRDR